MQAQRGSASLNNATIAGFANWRSSSRLNAVPTSRKACTTWRGRAQSSGAWPAMGNLGELRFPLGYTAHAHQLEAPGDGSRTSTSQLRRTHLPAGTVGGGNHRAPVAVWRCQMPGARILQTRDGYPGALQLGVMDSWICTASRGWWQAYHNNLQST